jgi:hypothetical protein
MLARERDNVEPQRPGHQAAGTSSDRTPRDRDAVQGGRLQYAALRHRGGTGQRFFG